MDRAKSPIHTKLKIFKRETDMILNLTQHEATPEQKEAGVIEPSSKDFIKSLLTFDHLPDTGDLIDRAERLAEFAHDLGHDQALIGGAPFFMAPLEKALLEYGIQPVYAFSVRESVEKIASDGSVTKTNVFKHVGFFEV